MALADYLRETSAEAARAKAITDSKSVPLSGSDATDFTTHTNAAKGAATSVMQDSFFDGLTPSLRSGPPPIEDGPDYPPWLADLGAEAEIKGTKQNPTLANKQDCLDCCHTIEQRAQASIDECT